MNADKHRDELNGITEQIIGCAYKVANTLGCGFLEKVYENALVVELQRNLLKVVQQAAVKVQYEGVDVGEYIADILVENAVIIEVKAVKSLDEIHVAQCLNYLKATGFAVCLLINFGSPKIEIRRVVRGF